MIRRKYFTHKKSNTCDAHGSRLALRVRKYFEKKIYEAIFRLILQTLGPFGGKVNFNGNRNPAQWLLCALD